MIDYMSRDQTLDFSDTLHKRCINFLTAEEGLQDEIKLEIQTYFYSRSDSSVIVHTESGSDELEFMFVDDHVIKSNRYYDPRPFQKINERCLEISKSRSKSYISDALNAINGDFERFGVALEIERNHKQRYPKNMDTLQSAIFVCMAILFVKRLAGIDQPLVLYGKWFNEADGKSQYALCRVLSKYVKQLIIITGDEILDGHANGEASLYERLASDRVCITRQHLVL